MRGKHVVLLVAAAVVAISAVVGATVPLLLPALGSPPLFPFPATPLGYAAYGGLTAGALCAVGVLALEAASRAE